MTYPKLTDFLFLIPRYRYYRITANAILHGRLNIDQFLLFAFGSVMAVLFTMALITIEMTF